MKTNKQKILEKKAALLRQQFGYNNSEPIQLNSLLLKQGIITLYRSLDEDFSGMALKVEENGQINRFMMINRLKTLGHQHFTICHELYHLYIQENFVSQVCKTAKFDKKDSEEYNADIFASFFLLPEEGLYANISDQEISNGHIALSTILRIENIYECSHKALLFRLFNLNLIDESYFETNRNITQIAKKYGYSPYLYSWSVDDSSVGNYGELARELYEKEKISESHYYDFMSDLGFSIDDIELVNDAELD